MSVLFVIFDVMCASVGVERRAMGPRTWHRDLQPRSCMCRDRDCCLLMKITTGKRSLQYWPYNHGRVSLCFIQVFVVSCILDDIVKSETSLPTTAHLVQNDRQELAQRMSLISTVDFYISIANFMTILRTLSTPSHWLRGSELCTLSE